MSSSSVHVSPLSTYIGVFAGLMFLTGLTVFVAFQDFGALNDVIALGIAGLKTTLVVLWFMHLKYSEKLVMMFAASGLVFILILLAITSTDYVTRIDILGW